MEKIYFCALVNTRNGCVYFTVNRDPDKIKYRLMRAHKTGFAGSERFKLHLADFEARDFRFDILDEAPESKAESFCAEVGQYIVNNWNVNDLYNVIQWDEEPSPLIRYYLNGTYGEENRNPIPVWYTSELRSDHHNQFRETTFVDKVSCVANYFDPVDKLKTQPKRQKYTTDQVEAMCKEIMEGRGKDIIQRHMPDARNDYILRACLAELEFGDNPIHFCDWLRERLAKPLYRYDPTYDGDPKKSQLFPVGPYYPYDGSAMSYALIWSKLKNMHPKHFMNDTDLKVLTKELEPFDSIFPV